MSDRRRLLKVLAGTVASRVLLGPAMAGSAALPAPKFYVIGAYAQPVGKHAAWKTRGVNTLFAIPDEGGNPVTEMDNWRTSAIAKGLKQVRYPRGVTFNKTPTGASLANYSVTNQALFEADMASGELLAVAFADEPSDVKNGGGIGYGSGAFDPLMMDTILATWRGRGVPIWLNQLGNHIRNEFTIAYMRDFADGGLVDWFASDSYPQSEGRTSPASLDGTWSTDQGHDLERVRSWSGGRPQMSFIETVRQFSNSPTRTVDAFNTEIRSNLIHGAFGHCYFSINFTGTGDFYDNTQADILAAMTAMHAYIASIHDNVLIDTVNGGRRPYLPRPGMPSGTSPTGLQLPYPFEGAEITCGDGRTYRMLLNNSGSVQTITDSRWGLSSLSVPAWGFAYGYSATEMIASVAPPAYAAFQTATAAKSVDITLSNNNRTATVTGPDGNRTDGYCAALGDTVVGARNVYFEITTTGMANDGNQSGIGLTTRTTKTGPGTAAVQDSGTVVMCPGEGRLYKAVFSAITGAYAAGDGTFGFAIRGGDNKLYVNKVGGQWNGDILANQNPATGAGGITVAGLDLAQARIFVSLLNQTDAVTINTGQAAYAGTPPAGFVNL